MKLSKTLLAFIFFLNINNIKDLKRNLRRCREIIIYRRHNYYHHVFVGDANEIGCNFNHYSCNIASFWFAPPAQIKKERLIYALYNVDKAVKKIFDFKNGDKVTIVKRNNVEDEEGCIQRAESRLGEKSYSIAYNNCESYVNWIFSGDNTSKQYINAPIRTRALVNLFDEFVCMGVLRIMVYLFMACCVFHKMFSNYFC